MKKQPGSNFFSYTLRQQKAKNLGTNSLCCFQYVDSNNQSISRNMNTTCECLMPSVRYPVPVPYWISRNIYITTNIIYGIELLLYEISQIWKNISFPDPGWILIHFTISQFFTFYVGIAILLLLTKRLIFSEKNMDSCHIFVKEEKTDSSFQFHLPVDSLFCQVSLFGTFARIWIRIQAFTLFRIQVKPWFLLTKN
jgi:hypothetical protein